MMARQIYILRNADDARPTFGNWQAGLRMEECSSVCISHQESQCYSSLKGTLILKLLTDEGHHPPYLSTKAAKALFLNVPGRLSCSCSAGCEQNVGTLEENNLCTRKLSRNYFTGLESS